jgi:hypothetical protein
MLYPRPIADRIATTIPNKITTPPAIRKNQRTLPIVIAVSIEISPSSDGSGAVASGSQGGEQKLALHLCEESRKRSGDASSHCALNLLNQPIIVSQKPRLVKGILFWREYSL